MKIFRLVIFALLILVITPGLLMAHRKSAHYVAKIKPKHKLARYNNSCGPRQLSQNLEADREGLERIADSGRLEVLIASGDLVPLPENEDLIVDPRLDPKWRFVRPWTKRCLLKLGKRFHNAFGEKLQINSAVRTKKRQEEIRKHDHNHNAARPDGPCPTVHTTGSTIDISKIKPELFGPAELEWLRDNLEQMRMDGEIEYKEERSQAVFHIMVFNNYNGEE